MEDPTFSDIISFICLSDSQFIWLPIKFFFYSSVPTTVHLQKKGHKVFLTRKSTTPNTSATTQKWWEQNGCHTIKSVILYLIYTRNCVDLKRTEHGDFGAELNEIFASFQRKKRCLYVLNMSRVYNLKNKRKKDNKIPKTVNNWLNIFWHKLPAHHQSKWEGESRSEEGSTTPELLTVFQVLHMATAILAGRGVLGDI